MLIKNTMKKTKLKAYGQWPMTMAASTKRLNFNPWLKLP